MRAVYLTLTVILVVLGIIGANLFLKAEAVDHHGFQVDIAANHYSCLSCHNGTVAKDVPRCMPVCFFGESHPLTNSYPPPNRKDEFKTAAEAEQSGVKLVNGKIDCISCHSLVVSSRYHLRVQDNDQLCYSCHHK